MDQTIEKKPGGGKEGKGCRFMLSRLNSNGLAVVHGEEIRFHRKATRDVVKELRHWVTKSEGRAPVQHKLPEV